jgi:hypothetical protein
MGRILLIGRLAGRDLRHRPAQSALLLVVISAAMATLTLGLIVHGVTSHPFAQTRAATAGPDVVADSAGLSGPAELGRFTALADAPGVTTHSGPYPVAWPVLTADGVLVEGRDTARAPVDQPDVLQGSWAVLDTRRFSAVVRSLGATPEQTMTALSLTQLLPALAGALLGIPAGTALYRAVRSGGPVGSPPAWWLLAMVAGMLQAEMP